MFYLICSVNYYRIGLGLSLLKAKLEINFIFNHVLSKLIMGIRGSVLCPLFIILILLPLYDIGI